MTKAECTVLKDFVKNEIKELEEKPQTKEMLFAITYLKKIEARMKLDKSRINSGKKAIGEVVVEGGPMEVITLSMILLKLKNGEAKVGWCKRKTEKAIDPNAVWAGDYTEWLPSINQMMTVESNDGKVLI